METRDKLQNLTRTPSSREPAKIKDTDSVEGADDHEVI